MTSGSEMRLILRVCSVGVINPADNNSSRAGTVAADRAAVPARRARVRPRRPLSTTATTTAAAAAADTAADTLHSTSRRMSTFNPSSAYIHHCCAIVV